MSHTNTNKRFVGIDIGAETLKVVELVQEVGANTSGLVWKRRQIVEHRKEPERILLEVLAAWGWDTISSATVSGRLSRQVNLPRIPTKQAQAMAYRYLNTDDSATIVSIGSHGFSVLELRPSGAEVFRENSRCSQGTGNFLRQLVERFNMTIEEASEMCATVDDPAPLSGRCPVILKTDMTHLANKGESRARILAGLYDAVCENVQVLIKPRVSPPKVVLVGGVSRALRIRDNFRQFLFKNEMALSPTEEDDALFFEALGCAVLATQREIELPSLSQLVNPPEETHLDRLPALADSLPRVKRMPKQAPASLEAASRDLVLGFDIGSTGSKVVAMDRLSREMVWEGYINTNGNPVVAAQTLTKMFVEGPANIYPVIAIGATGSGREIVGSLMATCYGGSSVYVLNEIAAHAEGALYFDNRVDTIFEIGGQDAKYIRLADGRVVDAAMNEACSAGTGSFIEEQGRKFKGIENVVHLGREALGAAGGVSLGQHCSVFMAEIIDEAVAQGVEQREIIAGIYDSIIQNYLNRVKGSRSVGEVIFCQGMPFAADALAAAVARQTGSEVIIPPNPGTVGALGIGLLTIKNFNLEARVGLDLHRFMSAVIEKKDTFICKSTLGCGGAGNKCRIDRLTTVVDGERQRFTWGGGCSMYDKGTGKQKLPDRAPDPFRQREELVREIVERISAMQAQAAPQSTKRQRVAITDEFMLKSLFPFFVTFIHELGLEVAFYSGAEQSALKRGIEEANVPFCAPMQQYHGLVSQMLEDNPDILLLPMLRSIPRVGDETHAKVCPIVQASPDMLKWDLLLKGKTKIISPMIEIGVQNLFSQQFIDSCQRLANDLGVTDVRWRAAYAQALGVQTKFDEKCLQLGQAALDFCQTHDITPVVVLGRTYTIYNKVLNSNVPSILREQGAIGIPVDCYPVSEEVPIFRDVYWGYGQRNLRAAHQIRRQTGIYSLFCSNYSCGPDSFVIHFYGYMMEGKPFAIIETDGHSGDAGTKTRVEAFLHCVRADKNVDQTGERKQANSFKLIELDKEGLNDVRRREEIVLIPRMGPGAEALAAALRGLGIRAEALAEPNRETVRIGRRHTSGKECVPMCITTGSLLQRVEQSLNTEDRFAFFMPTANGPCRFGVYNLLHKIILERQGLKDRVRIWSPVDHDYFGGVPKGFAALVFSGFMAADLLLEAMYDSRPVEKHPGAARATYVRYQRELASLLEREAAGDLSMSTALLKVADGSLFGVRDLLERAGADFKALKTNKALPTVLVVGEIYVRCDPFANDFVIDKLEARGIRARFAPFNEWIEYTDWVHFMEKRRTGAAAHITSMVRGRIQRTAYQAMAAQMDWPPRTSVHDSLAAAAPYIRRELNGEAVLTVGGPVHEWREGHIDGVVSVGPLECMPNKISEAQFFHVAEQEGLASLTLALNGDPVDPEIVDNFAYEVHSQFLKRAAASDLRQTAASRERLMPEIFEYSRSMLEKLAARSLAAIRVPARREKVSQKVLVEEVSRPSASTELDLGSLSTLQAQTAQQNSPGGAQQQN